VIGKTDLSALEGFEVNAEYPLGKFMQIKATGMVDVKQAMLQVTLFYDAPPTGGRSVSALCKTRGYGERTRPGRYGDEGNEVCEAWGDS
jgi:hypothetical protein